MTLKSLEGKTNWTYIPPPQNNNKRYVTAFRLMANEYWAEAVTALENELRENPEDNQALHYLGVAYVAGRKCHADFQKGIGYIHQSILKEPKNYRYIHNFAQAALQKKHYETARQMYQACLDIEPHYAQALMGLVTTYICENMAQKALPLIQKLKKLIPTDKEMRLKEVEVLLECCEFEKAEFAVKSLIAEFPYFINAHLKSAALYSYQGKDRLALKTYFQALRLCEDEPLLKLNLGITLMAQRKLRMGGSYYRARYDLPRKEIVPSEIKTPVWQGEDLSGKTLFLYREQGFGDIINFIRYLPEVLNKFKPQKIYFAADPRLIPLLKNSFQDPRISWLSFTHELEKINYDYHAPLVEAMLNLKISYETIKLENQYLFPKMAVQEKWKNRFAANQKKKIGICWAGNKMHENDRNRSMRPDQFMQIFDKMSRDNVDLYNLLVGLKDDKTSSEFLTNNDVFDITNEFKDFDESAAMMSQLDLVITVDTATAHLAGALGKRVWVLIPFNHDWRWFEQQFETTKWYPSMTLFRQKSYKNWDGVIERVKSSLQNFLDS